MHGVQSKFKEHVIHGVTTNCSLVLRQIFINSFEYFKPFVNLVHKNIYISGDIELNPGPVFCNSVQNNSPTKLSSNVILEQSLRSYQLKYLYSLALHIRVNNN